VSQSATIIIDRPAKEVFNYVMDMGSGGYVCEAIGDSTRFTLEANIKPTGPLRVLGPIFGMMVRRQISADVELLKTILES
jgi:hypothetical protein